MVVGQSRSFGLLVGWVVDELVELVLAKQEEQQRNNFIDCEYTYDIRVCVVVAFDKNYHFLSSIRLDCSTNKNDGMTTTNTHTYI